MGRRARSTDSALIYLEKALRIFEEIGYKSGISECNHNLGELYLDRGSYIMAAGHYLKALYLYDEIGDIFYIFSDS